MKKMASVLCHAFQMVLRTWKSYALLSVTIVLSFSLLLGYLTFSDSGIYNEYKELFSYRREDIRYRISADDADRLPLLVDGLSAMENTAYYVAYVYHLGYMSTKYAFERNGEQIELYPAVTGFLMPDYSWPEDVENLYWNDQPMDIVWLDGQEHKDFTLEADQVILTEALYRTLELDQQETPVFQLNLQYGQKIPLRVAGYSKEYTCEMWQANRNEYVQSADNGLFHLILSTKFIEYAQLYNKDFYGLGTYDPMHDISLDFLYVQIYSETPEKVLGLLESMDSTGYSAIYMQQNAALDEIRPQKQVKSTITCALLLILGVNLYSCFSNALNDRKFEIGVKRAMGASGFDIVRQFLYESCIVMAANILLSISLVADVAVVYKYIVERTPDAKGVYPNYILYLSPYSAAMFSICALSLTVVFSLVFAYKSTRVEIVQYLKAE